MPTVPGGAECEGSRARGHASYNVVLHRAASRSLPAGLLLTVALVPCAAGVASAQQKPVPYAIGGAFQAVWIPTAPSCRPRSRRDAAREGPNRGAP